MIRNFPFNACFLYSSWTSHQFESVNHIVNTNGFYKSVLLAFFFESSYIRYNNPKWISTFIWFWSCVCFLWPKRWHVKFFWTFRYFRLQSLHLISSIVKSLVCRNSTRFHIESLRKLNYGICTYGKRREFFCFSPVASFILQSIFLIRPCLT